MRKRFVLVLIGATALSCKEPESTPDNPCYTCQIAETFQDVTNTSYWDRCGEANVATFIQENTNRRIIPPGSTGSILTRTATCALK